MAKTTFFVVLAVVVSVVVLLFIFKSKTPRRIAPTDDQSKTTVMTVSVTRTTQTKLYRMIQDTPLYGLYDIRADFSVNVVPDSAALVLQYKQSSSSSWINITGTTVKYLFVKHRDYENNKLVEEDYTYEFRCVRNNVPITQITSPKVVHLFYWTQVTPTTISLAWAAHAAGAGTTYKIWYKPTTKDEVEDWVQPYTKITTSGTSHTIVDLSPRTMYQLGISVVDSNMEGPTYSFVVDTSG